MGEVGFFFACKLSQQTVGMDFFFKGRHNRRKSLNLSSSTHMFQYCRHIGICLTILISTIAMTSCDRKLMRNDLEAIKSRGELVLLTRNNSACYYESAHGYAGFEYDLAKSFATHLGVQLRTVVVEEEVDMVEKLLKGEADIIAPGSPFGPPTNRMVNLGPGYLEVLEQVVGRRGGPKISDLEDLGQTPLWVTRSSAGLEQLKAIKKQHSDIQWRTLADQSSEELLHMVWNESVPLTLIESNVLTLNRRFYPELVVHMNLGEPRHLRWAMHPQSRHLHRAVEQWFAKTATRDTIKGLVTHYYSHLEDFDYVDIARYRRRIGSRLPKYQGYFEGAAGHYGLDWQLVAAQAYQESHWNPRARSFTGVRGIMMLTLDTARSLGLKNRLAVEDSIYAGTRYLSRLHRMVGDGVAEPDRTLMALAAYNIGFGHLKDARQLARRLGKPDNTWRSLREFFPLLQKKKYYKTLPHGYARGNEAVQYVDRIRTYHKILHMAKAPRTPNGLASLDG